MAVFIETCPKCGKDLTRWQVAGNLPFTEHYMCKCGFEWRGNTFVRRIPFEPPKEKRKDSCADCVHYPPSSTDGKPCCACDPANPLTNCHEAKEETE